MNTRRELITPAIASKMLETNTHNRAIQQRLVNQYARDMKDGNWREHHQGIGFDVNGTLVDGQHRLWAIIEANVSIYLQVTRGIAPEAMAGIDIGKGRTNSDLFTLDGIPRAGRIVPMATMLSYITRKVPWNSLNLPTKQEVRQTYEAYKDALDWASFGELQGFQGRLRSAAPGTSLAMFYQRHPEQAEQFRQLLTMPVNQGPDSPVLATRMMLERWPRDMSHRRQELLEHMLSGCYSFLMGRKIKIIRPSAESTRYFCEGIGEIVTR